MSLTIRTYAFWNPNSSCQNGPSTVQHNSQGMPPMSELPIRQIHLLKLAYQDPSWHNCTPKLINNDVVAIDKLVKL